MKKPILVFTSQNQLDAYTQEWQERLFLRDWFIKAKLVSFSELENKESLGENNYDITTHEAKIAIGELEDNQICNFNCQELTLIHELVHCKLTLTDGISSSLEGNFISNYEHSIIEQLAKSLLMAKYNLSRDWFYN